LWGKVTQAVYEQSAGALIAIDGKTLRGACERGERPCMIHMVSAWASQNRLVLGQCKVEEKSNEITAIPELLRACFESLRPNVHSVSKR